MPTKINKIKNFILSLRDVRTLGVYVFVVISLLVTWSSINSIQTNYELQKQISALQQQNDVQRLENTNLGLSNQYFNTDQFLELSARRQFGLAAPGETVWKVPKSVALAHSVPLSALPTSTAKKNGAASTQQRNFQAWIDFFLHRQG